MNGDKGQIKAKREAAARARRLLSGVSDEVSRSRMMAFADALEAEADALERAMAAPKPQVTQVQMQMQQGPPAKDEPDKDER